jgi:hypothetical protein
VLLAVNIGIGMVLALWVAKHRLGAAAGGGVAGAMWRAAT